MSSSESSPKSTQPMRFGWRRRSSDPDADVRTPQRAWALYQELITPEDPGNDPDSIEHRYRDEESGTYWFGATGVGVGAAYEAFFDADPRTVIEEICWKENAGLGLKVTAMMIDKLGPKK